jgi:hypothetical protein
MVCLCGDPINPSRLALGYRTCLPCGEDSAKQARRSWCVVPLNKSNYVLVTDPSLLKGLNPKRMGGKVVWDGLLVVLATFICWLVIVFVFSFSMGSM